MRILKGWTKEEQEELEDAEPYTNLKKYIKELVAPTDESNMGAVWVKVDEDCSSNSQVLIDIIDYFNQTADFAVPVEEDDE